MQSISVPKHRFERTFYVYYVHIVYYIVYTLMKLKCFQIHEVNKGQCLIIHG